MDSFRTRLARGACFASLALISFSTLLCAQPTAGEIRLEVKDPSGAAVQASGKLQSVAGGAATSFQTDVQGRYTAGSLAQGTYRLEISKTGFAPRLVRVEVGSGKPVTTTITLELASQATSISVVSVTPLPGSDLSRDEIAAPVQAASQKDLQDSGSLELSDLLNRRLSGVNINENQGNPFQADLNYRGYTASPLLGTPEGISVYVDGVRQNQPFGDVVSWDLIPRIAISEAALVPGSNPLFGLNTLGGAVSIATKDGRSQPGTAIQVSGGAFGRRAVEFEHGGSNSKGLNWYLAGNLFHEDGWRIKSPSDVKQVFSKVGWQGVKTTIGLSLAYADNSLTGNGVQEQRFLSRNYASGYTYGDVTANRSPSLNLILRRALANSLSVSVNAYYRYVRADSINPNLNTNSLDESVYQPSAADQAALKAAGYSGYPTSGANASNTPFPYWRCIAQALQFSEPVEKCNALIIRSFTKQNNYGLSGQATWNASPHGHRNQLTAGAAWDRSSMAFQQATQFGYINPDYTITGVNSYEDGSTNSNGTPVDTRVNLHGIPYTWSLYATDTIAVSQSLSLTVSGRFNRAVVNNRDRISPGGGPGSLDGNYVFTRFNPSVGATWSPNHLVNFYGSYSESSRAPTSIELGCADPDNPCSLPNALAGDPPLKQVFTRTFEAGARSTGEKTRLSWSAGWFRASNQNDLLFVTSSVTGNGYFRNFGETLRQGAEAHLSGRISRFNLGGNYTYLSATYQSPETLNGGSNSSNDSALSGSLGMDGVIQIKPGNVIPLSPHHTLKAFADVQATKALSIDLSFLAVSSSFARGNENSLSKPDGVYYLGPGTSPGYGVVNLAARYQINKHIQVFGQVNNLLDHHYYTAALLGPTGFNAQGNFVARPFPADASGNYPLVHATFYAPGAPIGAWGGVRVSF